MHGGHVPVSPGSSPVSRLHRPRRPQREDEEQPGARPPLRPLQTPARHRELPLLPVPGGRVSTYTTVYYYILL